MLSNALGFLLLGILSINAARAQQTGSGANTTTCADPSVTWFNTDDDLNPCEQYLRLRSHCEPGYKVPSMSLTVGDVKTPDTCASPCCCNTVAFNLAMMCLSCQQGNTVDAPKEAYVAFLGSCGSSLSANLPNSIQKNVCDTGPKLKRWEYEVFYDDGSWSYAKTKETADAQAKADADDADNRCVTATPSKDATVTIQSSPVSSPLGQKLKKNPSGVSVGAVVGAVLAAVFVCGLGFFALWWFYLRGPRVLRRRDPRGGNEGDFDLLPSNSRTPSMTSQDLARVYANNPYVNNSVPRPRPETQTFSELTLPVPLAVPSDFNYQSSYSGTPLSPRPRDVPGGWRNGTAPSVIHSVSSRETAPTTREAAPTTLTVSNANTTTRDQPLSP